jgi:hypothetical protein
MQMLPQCADCLQVKELAPQRRRSSLDLREPAIPELKFTPQVLLTLIPQIYLEKIEADQSAEERSQDHQVLGISGAVSSFVHCIMQDAICPQISCPSPSTVLLAVFYCASCKCAVWVVSTNKHTPIAKSCARRAACAGSRKQRHESTH